MRTIPLTQGKVAIVDDDDFERLNQFKWHALRNGPRIWYAVRLVRPDPDGPQRAVLMHRLIIGNHSGWTDHINGDGLDNRRSNLRVCTRSQNLANSKLRSDNTSGFKGVCRFAVKRPTSKKWRAKLAGQLVGNFHTKEEAAQAYNRAAKETYGEFALLNEVKN
jgi:hypothetical protein